MGKPIYNQQHAAMQQKRCSYYANVELGRSRHQVLVNENMGIKPVWPRDLFRNVPRETKE